MLQHARQHSASRIASGALLLACAGSLALSQDVSITRTPRDSNLSIRLENLNTHVVYDRAGGTYFIVPAGRYSVQLMRDDQQVYQEAEYISADSPPTRTVDPSGSGIIVGLSQGNPNFGASPCAALQDAAQLAVAIYGIHDADLQRRRASADIGDRCGNNADVDTLAGTLAGAYGTTPLGMVILSVEFTQLSPQRGPRHVANPNLDTTSARPTISPAQQPGANLNGGLVTDLRNGISDVAIDVGGRPFLVCAAMDANTPLFCDQDGTVMAPNVNPHLASLYRLRVKTSPVNHRGVEEDHWTSFVSEDEYHATQQKLANDIQAIQSRLLRQIGQVEADAPSAAGAAGQNARTYPVTEITSLIATTQTEIDAALHDPTLQPLRQAFPKAIAQLSPNSPAAIPAIDAQRIFQQLKLTVELLEYVSGNLGIDLIFRTTPVETEGARLTFEACDRCNPVISQGGQHRFYRGRYHIRVSLDGYVPYEGTLDLVEDPRTILECEMVRVHHTANGHTSSCSLKSQ